jgi:amidase/6-aminohexanoate-cyclic-dimer hydrolase
VEFDEYRSHDAIDLAALVADGSITATELLDIALQRTAATDATIAAVVHVQEAVARRTAAASAPGPLAGVPFLLKDLGCEAVDFPTSMGSQLFDGYRYSGDSEMFVRLAAAGLVAFGRTTSPELGIGPTTEAGVYGRPTRNPWSLDHVAGGSSGGAAAAVAAGIVPAAHGSDGGGSVRIPASSCGLFGLKPTRARLPDGPFAGEGWAGMAIDGFLTRSVRDSAALLDAVHGPDIGAPYFAPPFAGSYLGRLHETLAPLRIAVSSTSFTGAAVHPDCAAAVDHAARLCEQLGHHVEAGHPPVDIDRLMRAWTVIVACGTHLTVRERLAELGDPELADRLDGVTRGAVTLGERLSGADYLAAVGAVHAAGRQMARWLGSYDMLLTPTLAEPPALIGRFAPTNTDFMDYRMGPSGVLHYSPYTALANATGQPAMSVPLWWNADNLPVGVHFMANTGEELALLQLAAGLEAAAPWFHRVAPLT